MIVPAQNAPASWTLLDSLPAGKWWRVLAVLVGAGVITFGAQVSTPSSGDVPGTLQPLAVLLVGATLGPWLGALAVAVYVAAGALGAPVFAGGASGFGGPTSGYFIGFIVAAAVVGLVISRGRTHPVSAAGPRVIGGMLAGLAVIYIGGIAWLMGSVGLTISESMSAGFNPFIVGDLFEALIASAIVLALISRYAPKAVAEA